jgi:SAM-dependent methyltransferase
MKAHERHNRTRWDQESDRYQAGHGAWIGESPDAWGAWRIPEADLRLLPDVAGKDVLELGCGGGQWSVWLAQHGARVTGIDLSGRQLDHARRNVAGTGAAVALAQGSAERLPFARGAFDLVISDHGAMSWGDPQRTVPEVARVLRTEGLLIFCATSPLFSLCWEDVDSDRSRWARWARWARWLRWPGRRTREEGPGERLRGSYFDLSSVPEGDGARSFTIPHGEWVRLFREHGLAVEALLEPRPPAGTISHFYPEATAWAQRWPAETIWQVRREPPLTV